MTPERAKLLGELLTELSQDARGFIPDEAWLPAQRAFALPYVEMAIVRRRPRSKIEILLTNRNDENWNGWHIPGGLWRTRQTLDECVASLVQTELNKDARVSLLAQGMWEKWHDHPYGMPISHVVLCLAQNVAETESMRWFDDVPDGMIEDNGHHVRFIRSALREAETLVW